MKYQGSKRRIAKYIIPIMLNSVEINEETIFYDVFCGGANLIDKVPLKNRIAIDNDDYLIEALKVIRDNPTNLPKNNKEFTEKDYSNVKNNKEKYPKWFVGYVGFALSWGGRWFSSFRRDSLNRDYVKEAYNSAIKQSKLLQGIEFICLDYKKIKYKKNSIIYCDPPYQNTAKYKCVFNHVEFWDWVRKMSKDGYNIFVSEYNAPEDFKVVWEKEIINELVKTGNKRKRIEKLFKWKGE